MKIQKYILPLVAMAALASCGGESSSPAATSEDSSDATSSKSAPIFEAFTLSQLHDARVAKSLLSLNEKYVSVKGKVTCAKHFGEDDGALVIQSGKYALEVAYPDVFNVNVGDAVEVKGRFNAYDVGGTPTISLSTYRSTVPDSDIKVIDEAIQVETVTISKDTDVLEFDASLASIDFNVVGERKNAAFVGKLSEGTDEYIVSNKLSVTEKVPEGTFVAGDKVHYEGIFTYSGSETIKVLRYFDKDAFTKKGGEASSSAPAGKLSSVYFKDVEWWAADSARTGIYLWEGDNKNAAWPGEAMESLGNGIWKFDLTGTSFTKLIFTRIGATDLADWGAKTIDLTIADIDPAKPMYDISEVTTPTWGDPGVNGTWAAYAA